MATEPVDMIFDEILEAVAEMTPRPRWSVESREVKGGFSCTIAVAECIVARGWDTDLGKAHRRALEQVRKWREELEINERSLEPELAASCVLAPLMRGGR